MFVFQIRSSVVFQMRSSAVFQIERHTRVFESRERARQLTNPLSPMAD